MRIGMNEFDRRIYLHIYGLIFNQHNDLLPVGLIIQLVEHCTGIAGVGVWSPIQFRPESFWSFLMLLKQRFHSKKLSRSSCLVNHQTSSLHCETFTISADHNWPSSNFAKVFCQIFSAGKWITKKVNKNGKENFVLNKIYLYSQVTCYRGSKGDW